MGFGEKNEKEINGAFRRVREDIERQNIKIMLLESSQQRIEDTLREIRIAVDGLEQAHTQAPKKQESQEILSVSDLRKIIQEEIGKALEQVKNPLREVFSTETETIEEPYEEIEEKPISMPHSRTQKKSEDGLKKELLKTYERNRKDIIKQQILTEASKTEVSKIGLRDIIVDQKKYCSKASFYRYLEELEYSNLITFSRKKGKTVVTPHIQLTVGEQE